MRHTSLTPVIVLRRLGEPRSLGPHGSLMAPEVAAEAMHKPGIAPESTRKRPKLYGC